MTRDYIEERTPVKFDISGISIIEARYFPPGSHCFYMYWHDRMEILRVLSGELLLRLPNDTIPIPAGSIAVINPRQPHEGLAGAEGVEFQTIMFDLSNFFNRTETAQDVLQGLQDGSLVVNSCCSDEEVIRLIDCVLQTHQTDDSFLALYEQGLLISALALLAGRYSQRIANALFKDSRMQQVIKYIDNHISEDLRCSTLCREFNYDQSYFCRRFKAVSWLSLTQYVLISRLEKCVAGLVQNPNLTIVEAARSCGFNDVGYFCKCFKQHYGLTPTQFRQDCAERARRAAAANGTAKSARRESTSSGRNRPDHPK